MRFPNYQRVIFDQNPLAEVICAIRHPRLLAIESVLPVELQAQLGDEYPALEQSKVRLKIEKAADSGSEAEESHQLSRSYKFNDESRSWSVGLTSTSFGITTSKYVRWEEFRDRLVRVIGAHERCYRTPYYSRLGLRYRDVIVRSALGLEGVPWRDLVRSELLGVLANSEVDEADIANSHVQNQVKLDFGNLVIQAYFVTGEESPSETLLMIDCDFYVEDKMERGSDALLESLDKLHGYAGQVFSWTIRDSLRRALQPRAIE